MIRSGLRSFRKLRHSVRNSSALDRALGATRPPILVHQMGKVASSTVRATLEAHAGLNVFHTHWINPSSFDHNAGIINERKRRSARYGDRDEFGRMIHARIVVPQHRADIVTLVRDPIARNLSSYFQHLDEIWGVKQAHQEIAMDELHRGFLDVFEHDEPLTWFDNEMREVFGIDVFTEPFPHDLRWQTFESSPFRLLLLRADTDDRVKIEQLGRFLGLEALELRTKNVGEDKAYASVYRNFRDTLVLPPDYIDRLLDARFTRHFFTDDERSAMRSRWSGGVS